MALVFPTSTLSLPMLCKENNKGFMPEKIDIEFGLSARIQSLLDNNINAATMNLNYFSDMAGVSNTTFKRQLFAEGNTFRQVLDIWRFKNAIVQLKNSNSTIKEVCEKLGYSNLPTFNRAFKRWTNVSPNKYRASATVLISIYVRVELK